MAKDNETSAVVDTLLKFLAVGGILTVTVFAPNAVQALDKPIGLLSKKLDKRERQREYQRYLRYMRQQGLIKYRTVNYEHGIQLTSKGKKRAEKASLDDLIINRSDKWDNAWHIVMFDIPEKYKVSRNYFSKKLRDLGLVQLQRSVWVHPFECSEEIEVVARSYGVERFVTYIKTDHISSSKKLKERFNFNF